MKAAHYTRYGPPEVVQVKDIPTPVPGPKEVLIRVHATTVNRTDCGFRSANYFAVRVLAGLFKPRRKVLGCEFAGEVVDTGSEVTQFRKGGKVFGFNDERWGGHAEYMVLPEKAAIVPLPEGWSYEQAAPLAEGGHYALCSIRAAKVQAGQQVLVNGATGAIGSAAVQLLKHIGAEVTAVCATPHLELVKSLGADTVVDYTQEDFTRLGRQFHLVFDAVGKSTFGKCKRLLKPKGIYVSTELGPGSQNIFLAILGWITGGRRVIFPLPLTRRSDLEHLKALAEAGKFRPVIDRSYALDDIVEAYRYVETGMKTGNVVVKVV